MAEYCERCLIEVEGVTPEQARKEVKCYKPLKISVRGIIPRHMPLSSIKAGILLHYKKGGFFDIIKKATDKAEKGNKSQHTPGLINVKFC